MKLSGCADRAIFFWLDSLFANRGVVAVILAGAFWCFFLVSSGSESVTLSASALISGVWSAHRLAVSGMVANMSGAGDTWTSIAG